MTEHDSEAPEADGARPEGRGARASYLPPPAFPPGSRHRGPRPSETEEAGPTEDAGEGDLHDAFISPDEPFPDRSDSAAGTLEETDEAEDDEGVAMGIGDDPHLRPHELRAGGDPHVMELTEKVGKLAQALRQRGEAGLHTDPDMDRFDATLRAYCVGYLAGRGAEGE